MSFNAAGTVPVTISEFGGLVTEASPTGLPEGSSPDCQDVIFPPGSVSSRPGLKKVFASGFPTNGFPFYPTLTYGKSFVNPTGQIENLFLDSNGFLYWEDLSNNPGVLVQIAFTTPGSYAKSCTAFGREYIAISDGLIGQECALQWDGTNLDRVTQDGPGAPPTVSPFSLPSVAMVATVAVVLTLDESDPAAQDGTGNFTRINCFTTDADIANVQIGNACTLSGYGGASAPMNGTWTVVQIYLGSGGGQSLMVLSASLPSTTVFSLGGTGTILTGTMVRSGNFVTVRTAAAHQLQVGYLAQITGVPSSVIGTAITSIVINNQDLPGIATVTTSAVHGLIPGLNVSLTGITAVAVGGPIVAIYRASGVMTVQTTTAHGLTPGATVVLVGAPAGFNSTYTIAAVPSTVVFTVLTPGIADAAPAAAGAVSLAWPIPDSPEPTSFEVLAAPTTTTFQVAVNYSNGTWTTGSVSYAWDGKFFVSTVLSSTAFQYQQYGPDATTGTVGNVTPYGQAAPGKHQCVMMFVTRQGYITAPSPPATFVANGGQYLAISDIALGPDNVVARIIAFTGSGGSSFFYIPVPAQVNGQQVSTATRIENNTAQSIVVDFSDNSLFAALGISIPGNNLAAQKILDGALGFGLYASRLITWGQRNRIQNLLNMGFNGGYLLGPSVPPYNPLGWAVLTDGGTLQNGHYGQGWKITSTAGGAQHGSLLQSMYQDAYGVPIAIARTAYTFRCWMQATVLNVAFAVTAEISSPSTGFTSLAVIPSTSMPAISGFVEVAFTQAMPTTIPSDLVFKVYAQFAGSVILDDLSVIYADNPYVGSLLFGSYINNPEALDGVTGKFGPPQDSHSMMDVAAIRNTLYLLTQDPAGHLHQTSDNGITEPAGWSVDQVASNCGLLSAFGLTKTQADDSTGSGGEEWLMWAASAGVQLFWGDQPVKISQEIQPNWDLIKLPGRTRIWALNDPSSRTVYFGLPIGTNATAPDRIYTMSYKALDTASQIAAASPFRVGSAKGQTLGIDHTRKWSPWTLKMNGAVLMYRQAGKLSLVMLQGNGLIPSSANPGYSNVYTLDPTKYTDDNYGLIVPYYTTYFLVTPEQERELKLSANRHQLSYLTALISGVGLINITFLAEVMSNTWPLAIQRTLLADPKFELECAGGGCIGRRIALRFGSVPDTPVDPLFNGFEIQNISAFLKPLTHLPVRGSTV